MEIILQGLPAGPAHPDVLVGLQSADDAGVYRLDGERAIVLTVDIITPIVDDPYTFGRIAAANSLSDVYAMGGRPLAALNISCFNPEVPAAVYQQILRGASDLSLAAGAPIVGGHTIKDTEIKFGMAVFGEVHPDRIVTNAGARAGDTLVLCKPLGTSAIMTAFKNDGVDDTDPAYAEAVASMIALNREPARIALDHGVHAMTDVTGFALSGHALQMARASHVTFELVFDRLPVFDRALELLAAGHTCGGGRANRERCESAIDGGNDLTPEQIELLHDPQTSGPLLLALPADRADAAVNALHAAGLDRAAIIGHVVEDCGKPLRIL